MKQCVECGSKLSVLSGYKHPTLGKGHLVCWNCHEKVDKEVALWREEVLKYKPTEELPVKYTPILEYEPIEPTPTPQEGIDKWLR